MKPLKGSLDKYFDVEWFSNFPQEKERLVFAARNLQIMDILYFLRPKQLITTEKYVDAFQLFSSIFNGRYVFTTFNIKKLKKHKKYY